RKDLAGFPRFAHPGPKTVAALYGSESTRRTYEALTRRAWDLLGSGTGVVLDATFRDAAGRRAVTAVGEALGVSVVFLECRAPEEDVRERLRSRTDDVSDATEEVYLRQRGENASFLVEPPARHVVLDTSRDLVTIAEELDRRFGTA